MRIDLVHFAASHEGIDYGDSLGCLVITGKEVIFSAQGYGSDSVFHQVVVNFDFTVQEETFEFFPSVEAISDGLPDGAFGQYLEQFCFKVFVQLVKYGAAEFLAEGQSLVGRQLSLPGLALHGIQRLDAGQYMGCPGLVVAQRLFKFAPAMGQAAGEGDAGLFFIFFIHHVAVALQSAAKVGQ